MQISEIFKDVVPSPEAPSSSEHMERAGGLVSAARDADVAQVPGSGRQPVAARRRDDARGWRQEAVPAAGAAPHIFSRL
ncbi:hypothetical protein GCM10019059_31200 [Camelimonas fluminis]|nr:hypothetical protein GCM10019059_31200 [Camelimonas fluminis]